MVVVVINVDFGIVVLIIIMFILGQGMVIVQCLVLILYMILLNVGVNVSIVNDVIIWWMKNINVVVIVNNYVGYQFYQDVVYILVWGVMIGINIQVGIGIGLVVFYIVYGQILNLSINNLVVGNYLDMVIVMIIY